MHFDSSNLYNFDDLIDGWYDSKGKPKRKHWLLDVLEFISYIDEEQRKNNLQRAKRLKFYIFLDEWWILFNQHSWQSFPLQFFDY